MRKILVRAAAGLGILLVVAASGTYAASASRLSRDWQIEVADLAVPDDPASVERGRHVATAVAKCIDCHGDDLGGKVMVEDPMFGTLAGPNLTGGAGGIGGGLSVGDWVRAIRHGVGRDGEVLVAMPSDEYALLGRDDLAAVIAYMRSLRPVDREVPETTLGPVGRVLVLAGELPLSAERVDHDAPLPYAPPSGPTAEYGRYLVEVGCVGCHGPGLSGGPMPGAPPDATVPTNITPTAIGDWTVEDLGRALREGKRPDGSTLDRFMPWPTMSTLTDEEVAAMHAYLQTVEPRPFGGR